MDVVINELSLDGQYPTETVFLDNLEEIVKITILFDKLPNITLLKSQTIWNNNVTATKTLQDLFYVKGNTLLNKLRVNLLQLTTNPPYWEDDRRHNCKNNVYMLHENNICGSGIAESIERDKVILSFEHDDFKESRLSIKKNSSEVSIDNFLDFKTTLLVLLRCSGINEETFCKYYFHGTNLDFSFLKDERGFGILNNEQKAQFIEQFKLFSTMEWTEIIRSAGLQYKQYKNILISYESENIYKFRVSQGYRCYGYRDADVFRVVQLEVDHALSDRG